MRSPGGTAVKIALASALALFATLALASAGRAQVEKLTDIEGIGPSYAAKLEAAKALPAAVDY
jgi:predicted flap endonuclease-1-like 5' DNA nuclease